MFRLKYKMIKKMIAKKVSSNDIDFILFLTKSLNELGQANDIHYKEVCLELGISKQSFYDIVERLNLNEIVKTNYLNKRTWDFIFDDNIFLSDANFSDSYLNTNRDFLFSNEFKSFKANEKLLVLLLLVLTAKNSFKISLYNLKNWFNVKCDSVILSYIESIKKYFYVDVNDNIFCFSQKTSVELSSESAKSKTFVNRLKRWCLKYKIGFTLKDLKDVYNLYFLFESRASAFFDNLISTSFDHNSLQPALLNFILYA